MNGSLEYAWGTYGTFPGGVWGVHQFSVDSEGTLYAAEALGAVDAVELAAPLGLDRRIARRAGYRAVVDVLVEDGLAHAVER